MRIRHMYSDDKTFLSFLKRFLCDMNNNFFKKKGAEDPEISNSCKKNKAMDEAEEKQVKKF